MGQGQRQGGLIHMLYTERDRAGDREGIIVVGQGKGQDQEQEGVIWKWDRERDRVKDREAVYRV